MVFSSIQEPKSSDVSSFSTKNVKKLCGSYIFCLTLRTVSKFKCLKKAQRIYSMSTLSNVATRGGEVNPPSVRLAPETFLEAKSSQSGVSVRYVHDSTMSWFVFRASYGRVDRASDFLVEDGTFVYIAKRWTRKVINGKQKKILVPLIPNLIFVYTTRAKAETYIKETPALSYLTFYYNHFAKDEVGKNPPLVIPPSEMENFIAATCNNNEHLMFVDESRCHYKSGEMVRVVDGVFAGVVGRVARVSGQQRVIVSLSNVGLISTAYVPTAFLQPLNS